mmetsp:Transcript_30826/g.66446  ORF Transcript_30826/g.66446 Transcript_30826/m.66446 type:complete len:117 (-) Transcript_30826:366-716(-)
MYRWIGFDVTPSLNTQSLMPISSRKLVTRSLQRDKIRPHVCWHEPGSLGQRLNRPCDRVRLQSKVSASKLSASFFSVQVVSAVMAGDGGCWEGGSQRQGPGSISYELCASGIGCKS